MVTMRDASIPLTTAEWEEWGNPNEEKYFEVDVTIRIAASPTHHYSSILDLCSPYHMHTTFFNFTF